MRGDERSHGALWRSLKPPGIELCAVVSEEGGWTLRGSLVRKFGQGPAGVSYEIKTDASWRTKSAMVKELFRESRSRLDLELKGGRWYVDGVEEQGLRGCSDVDLEASPVTNTLPIKRTGLGVGDEVELTAAWVRFPSLKVVPLRQGYRRVGRRSFLYTSFTGFKAEIEVDEFGLVKEYGNYWVAE